MNYVESFNLLGIDAKQIPCIKGEGAPTASTEGVVGCFYMDTLTGDVYKYVTGDTPWVLSGDERLVQSTGDSETAVMSQKAVTDYIQEFSDNTFDFHISPNLFDEKKATSGEGMYPNGTIYTNDKYLLTYYIPVEVGEVLTYQRVYNDGERAIGSFAYVCAFDSNKTILKDKGITKSSTAYTVPDGVAYVRLTCVTSTTPSLVKDIAVVKSEEILPYEPYGAFNYTLKESAVNKESIKKVIDDNIVQEVGDSTEKIMSQKAVTDLVENISETAIKNAENAVSEFTKVANKGVANSLKGRAVGETILINDVSPLEHKLEIKLSGDNVEGTKVKVWGKNLFNIDSVITKEIKNEEKGTDYGIINCNDGTLKVYTFAGSKSVYSGAPNTLRDYAPGLKVGEVYTLSAKSIKTKDSSNSNYQHIYLNGQSWKFGAPKTITEDMLSAVVHWYVDGKTNDEQEAIISNIQIEPGIGVTAYEPYVYVESVADLEGNVGDLVSISHKMTLATDNEDTIIDCVYNRDINSTVPNTEVILPKITTKNLLNVTFENARILSDGIFYPSTDPKYAAAPEYIPVEGGKKYTFSWNGNRVGGKVNVSFGIIQYDSRFNYLALKGLSTSRLARATHCTTDALHSDCKYIRIYLSYNATSSTDEPKDWKELLFEDFQMEKGDKATDYIAPSIIDPRITTNEEIPAYAILEAERVIDEVVKAQVGRTFTFAAISDLHYGNDRYTEGVDHACKALKYIDKCIALDAVAVLGDYTNGWTADDYNDAIADFRSINKVLDDVRFAPNLRIQGNHDYLDVNPDDDNDNQNSSKIHRYIQAYSDNVVWGDINGGYFYRDFDGYKIRVVCVNTSETGGSGSYINCTAKQCQWFASVLDLSEKDDASEWQILVLSHQPLDWSYANIDHSLLKVLDTYTKGGSYSNDVVSYDFTGKNAAKIIGNIHGHIHNLLVGDLKNTTIKRIATPEACINRSNTYDAYKEDVSYDKTVDTKDETSFVVYCVDIDASTIKAICYGAGYDRTIEY